MKKILVAICVSLVSLCVSAQKGESNVGANVLYSTDMQNIGLGLKYQYNITDAIRLEGVGNYYLKTDGLSMWDINVNGHYLFNVTDKLTLYPLVGINYTHWKQDDFLSSYSDDEMDDYEGFSSSYSDSSVGLNLGGGIQYHVTDRIKIGAEIKFQTISGGNTAVLGLGITYKL